MTPAGMPSGAQDLEAGQEITEALVALRGRDPGAMDRLIPLVYDQLRQVAQRQLGAEPIGPTLGTTALVHEAYLKLVDQTRTEWQDRAHFFAIASRAMRRILIDYARRHRAARRGGLRTGNRPRRYRPTRWRFPLPSAPRRSLRSTRRSSDWEGSTRAWPRCRVPLLRGSDRSGDRDRAGRVATDGGTRMGCGQGVALPGVGP